jgi:uncharacterized protein (TIGR02001 family)
VRWNFYFFETGKMMKNSYLCVASLSAIGLCAMMAPVTSHATTQIGDAEISGNVAFVSEYSFRGIAQSDEGPALQGGFDVSHGSGLYAGVWGSNVDFNDDDEASLEADIYAGYSGTAGGVNYDIGAIYYAYPGADDSLDYDFWEASLSLGYDFDIFSTSASVNYSPNFFGDTGHAEYYALNVDVPLPQDFSLSAHVGYQAVEDTPDYTDWSLGLGYSYADFDFALQYIDTNLDEPNECADGCSERVIFSVSRSF